MANFFDKAIATFAPGWGLKRAQARRMLAYYEAARPDRLRKNRRETGSADSAVLRANVSLREQARHLEQNHDVARNALNILEQNVVGANGIAIEPQPRRSDGRIHDEFARDLARLYRDFARRPEVTWEHDWASTQRLAARSWIRDGEALAQLLSGPIPSLNHGTRVPFSLELIEADHLPFDFNDSGRRISMGVEKNAWGRAIAYHIYREHPGDNLIIPTSSDLKRVPAERMLHIKLVDRIRQTRGVSIFAAVLNRLDDIKDYEESERIAAKVAASMAAVIIKGQPDMYEDDADGEPRNMRFRPGMVFDDLLPGEDIRMIDSSRPNPNLDAYLSGQMRRAAGGTRVSYSSLAKDYNGTYSAQRQELIEQWGAYGLLSAEFASQFVRPVWESVVASAIVAGQIRVPADVDQETITDALYVGPQMPWIDPLKEANAWAVLEEHTYASGPEIIRRRGQNPTDVLDQESRWRRRLREADISPPESLRAETAAEDTGGANAKVKASHFRA